MSSQGWQSGIIFRNKIFTFIIIINHLNSPKSCIDSQQKIRILERRWWNVKYKLQLWQGQYHLSIMKGKGGGMTEKRVRPCQFTIFILLCTITVLLQDNSASVPVAPRYWHHQIILLNITHHNQAQTQTALQIFSSINKASMFRTCYEMSSFQDVADSEIGGKYFFIPIVFFLTFSFSENCLISIGRQMELV